MFVHQYISGKWSLSELLYLLNVYYKIVSFIFEMHEFSISYSHTEWYLHFSDSATTSAQCVFGAKN